MPVTAIFWIVALLAIYGLAWHDQPAQPAVIERRSSNPEGATRRSKAGK